MVIGDTYTGRFKPKEGDNVTPLANTFDKNALRREGSVYIDWGPELPVTYPSDKLTVMIRDPFWVCFHWSLEGELSNRLQGKSGCSPHFVLSVSGEDSCFEYEIERICPFFWVNVEPGKYYSASIFALFDNRTIEICSIDRFRTPRPWIKARETAKTTLVTQLAEKFGYVSGREGLAEKLLEAGRANSGSAPELHISEGIGYPYSFGSSGG